MPAATVAEPHRAPEATALPIPLYAALARPLAAGLAVALALTVVAPAAPVEVGGPITVHASETVATVDGAHDFALPGGTTHLAIHWPGNHDAKVEAAFSTDGATYTRPVAVALDEFGEARGNGETYGAVMIADGARYVRVVADRVLPGVTMLAMDASGDITTVPGFGAQAAGVSTIPGVISRAGWGADETIRFDSLGEERWGRVYYPLQKLVIHHTAGPNNDPNPAATVRAIYRYHAVTQGWGDIGYQYLIDSAGRIYEGRYSRDYWNGTIPTADNGAGLVVEGGHAFRHNPGTMGIALLGTYSAVAPSAATQASLVRLLAWASATHGIDPLGTSLYVNPFTGITRMTANITGHRDYELTGCPGQISVGLLPTIRAQVAAEIGHPPLETYNPPRTLYLAAGSYVGRRFNTSGAIVSSKPYTLATASAAPTDQRSSIPGQGGTWYYITAGVWAGYWIQESGATVLSAPGPPAPVAEELLPWHALSMAAGTYTGYRFDTWGGVIGVRTYTLGSPSTAPTTLRSAIPNHAGNWYYITAGVWDGYWIAESSGTTLGGPPPPPPPPVTETYDPPNVLYFAAGTHVGRQFSATGAITATKTYTLATASAAPTDLKSTIPNQPGNWYHVTAGVWAGYWIAESASVTRGELPPPPPPPETYDPPRSLYFAAGTHVGRQFNATGAVTATKAYTLAAASSAPTSQKSAIPNQGGSWYLITAGVWAGYWIQESPATVLAGP